MIKVVFSWKDHPDFSATECEARYRAVHIPLARAAFEGVEGFRELRFNRVRRETVNDYNRREPREVDADVDAWVELYFESAELMQRAFERPQLGELFDDHPNFMQCDTPANIRVYHVDETVIHAAPQQLGLEVALRGTGAARAFLDRPVSRQTLRRVLDIARYAPSGGNKQSWRVIAECRSPHLEPAHRAGAAREFVLFDPPAVAASRRRDSAADNCAPCRS